MTPEEVDAYACGLPVPRPTTCPGCGSSRIRVEAAPPSLATSFGGRVPLGVCADCHACWEAFPELYVEDEVCAEPCDNCAFRPGSHEQRDREKWRALLANLRPDGDGLLSQGRFYCHKNVPIDRSVGPGNFLFPTKPGPVFEGVQCKPVWDTTRMRTCSGFLRMLWQLNGAAAAKRETTS